jgi:hypothetical protein
MGAEAKGKGTSVAKDLLLRTQLTRASKQEDLLCLLGCRDEVFRTIDDIFVSMSFGPGLELERVKTRIRLCYSEASALLASD